MWMRIALLLAALLVWDAATSDSGQSAVARSSAAIMSFGPVQTFVEYVRDGSLADDVKSLTSAASAGVTRAAIAVASVSSGESVATVKSVTPSDPVAAVTAAGATSVAALAEALEQDRAARRAAREKRRAEIHLAPEDVAKIAAAVADLYRQENKEAEAASPQSSVVPPVPAPGPVPTPEVVEESVASLGSDVLSAIIKASDETGANSGYLLHIALRESGLRLGAAAPTSSATGPFQFITRTWYQMIGTYGIKHDLNDEVALLKKSGSSYVPVSDKAADELLALRTDPYIAALMAGELTMENYATLTKLLGRTPAHGELYAAHVFGVAGAAKLVKTRDTTATTSAATILPSAAAANHWLFYSSNGTARSVTALFDELSRFMSTREVATVCNANLNFFGS